VRVRLQAHFVYRGGARCRAQAEPTGRTLRQRCRSLGEGGGVPVGSGLKAGRPTRSLRRPGSVIDTSPCANSPMEVDEKVHLHAHAHVHVRACTCMACQMSCDSPFAFLKRRFKKSKRGVGGRENPKKPSKKPQKASEPPVLRDCSRKAQHDAWPARGSRSAPTLPELRRDRDRRRAVLVCWRASALCYKSGPRPLSA